MRLLSHILIMLAFGASTYMAFAIARDVQADRKSPPRSTWLTCRMCGGCGKVPPLPEVIE